MLTRNDILSVLGIVGLFLGARPIAYASFLPGPDSIASFYSSDDHEVHCIVAKSNGDVKEVFYEWGWGNWTSGTYGTSSLFNASNMIGIGAYYSSSDDYGYHRHVIYAVNNSGTYELHEFYYDATLGSGTDKLMDTSGLSPSSNRQIVAVSAYYSPSDGDQHAVFATAYGNVYEYRFNPYTGQGYAITLITNMFAIGSIVDITGYETLNDNEEHVVVATTSSPANQLTELWFQGTGTVYSGTLSGSTDGDGYISIGGDYTPNFGTSSTDSIGIGDHGYTDLSGFHHTTYSVNEYEWGSQGHASTFGAAVDAPSDTTLAVKLSYIPAYNDEPSPSKHVFRAGSGGGLTWYDSFPGSGWSAATSLGSF